MDALPGRGGSAAIGRATVVAVTEGRQDQQFRVPQVQLANAIAAERINRRISRLMLGEETDSTLSLRRQLQQAERTCCYDEEDGQGWQAAGHGLTGCEYRVLLNEHGLLSLEYFREFTGAYTWESTSHATFDLRTGRVLKLADLVADAPAQLTRRMHGARDWSARRVRFQSDPGPVEEARAEEPDPENFALTPQELRLYYGPLLPHVMQNFEPDNTFPLRQAAAAEPTAALAKPWATQKAVASAGCYTFAQLLICANGSVCNVSCPHRPALCAAY